MAEYLNKEIFLQSMGLVGDETKYGNRDGEHQSRSYSIWMGYEIMGSVEDSVVEEDVVEVVRCKDCKHWKPGDSFGGDSLDDMQRIGGCPIVRFGRRENDFCSCGEKRGDGNG